MIALVPGSNGDGRGDANAGDWQRLATELGFGLIACNFVGDSYCYAARGSGKTLVKALEEFAKAESHPEIAKAPLLLWGHSAGGQFNYNFACWEPDRTIALIVNEGGFFYDTVASPQTRATPAIIFAGEKDTPERVQNLTKLFDTGRTRGALWAFCMEKGLGHAVGRSKEVAQQFFRAVVPMRLPAGGLDSSMKHLAIADGLLAASGSEAVPAADFKGRREPPRGCRMRQRRRSGKRCNDFTPLQIAGIGLKEQSMTSLRRCRWTAALVAFVTMAAWMVASNHCAIASLESPAKAAHACCQEKTPGQSPAAPQSTPCCEAFNVPVPEHVSVPAGHFFELPVALEQTLASLISLPSRDVVAPVRAHDPPRAPSFAETVLNRSLLAHAPPVFVA
jgi:pimeloyl-ACP methyl ester carboxylesterase